MSDKKEKDENKNKIKELLERAGKKDIEVRTLPVEFRIVRKEDVSTKIEGYASVFNSDSEDMGFIERVNPGAFKDALKISDSRALFNHDPNIVLGRQSAGTLELKEDKKGLWMVIDPPDTQLVRDMVLTPIERGDVREQSFGFTIEADEWKGLDTDKPIRTITKIQEIYDVSPVTYAAYQDTSVALRSLETARKEPTPTFTDPIIKITFGEETTEFSINDTEGIELYFACLRSESSPTTSDPDNASGEPTLTDPPDTTKDDLLTKINETIERYRE